MLNRAYSTLEIKAVDGERRIISGVASTPEPDRVGDVIEPLGAKFASQLPLLLFHDSQRPVGTVKLVKGDDGIRFEARLPEITDAGVLQDRVAEAWQSVKAGLIRGVSIGFRALDDGVELLRSGGLRFKAIEILELSLVAIPANASATIHEIKSIDAPFLAASGTGSEANVHTSSGASDSIAKAKGARRPMKTITEQIAAYTADRETKAARMNELMTKASDAGVTLDQTQSDEYDGLETEVESINKHLSRLSVLEQANKSKAAPVAGSNPEDGSKSRSGFQVIQLKQNLPPGIGFARVAIAKMAAFLSQGQDRPIDIAKQRWPDSPEIQAYFKATVAAGTSVDTTWAAPLVDQATLANEFIEYLRPMTIVGKFGTNGIPPLHRLPFNVRVPTQTTGGTGYWVGEGAPKPLTSFAFDAVTVPYTKVASIAVITQELARFSSPAAETIVRDQLAKACVERIDQDFIDPAKAASSGINPASITNGLTALTSAGTSAANVLTDLQNLLEGYILNNVNPTSVVLIMPNTLAMVVSLMENSLGQPSFPGMTMNGGNLRGIPVITSQYAANQATYGNLVIAVNASDIGLADDGQVTVDVSTEASLQMLDNPTNNSATGTATTMVSMFQTNSIAIRAERFIHWKKLRSSAVVFMDDVNWGAIGSPV